MHFLFSFFFVLYLVEELEVYLIWEKIILGCAGVGLQKGILFAVSFDLDVPLWFFLYIFVFRVE